MRCLSPQIISVLLLVVVTLICAPAFAEETGSRQAVDAAEAPAPIDAQLGARFHDAASRVKGLFQMVLFRDATSGELASIDVEPGLTAARVKLTYRF